MANEYGIFQSIVEGDQAEAYKKRKADEAEAARKADSDYMKNRWKQSDSVKSGSKEDKATDKQFRKGGYSSFERSGEDSEGNVKYSRAPGDKMSKQNPNNSWKHPIKTSKGHTQDAKNREKSDKYIYDDNNRVKFTSKNDTDYYRAVDAARRHVRRHNESSIDECSIEFI